MGPSGKMQEKFAAGFALPEGGPLEETEEKNYDEKKE
jgi:hypothetical protein